MTTWADAYRIEFRPTDGQPMRVTLSVIADVPTASYDPPSLDEIHETFLAAASHVFYEIFRDWEKQP